MGLWERRVAPFLKLLNGQPDTPPRNRVLFAFAPTLPKPYRVTIQTDASFGGRSSATFRVGKLGPGGGYGAVFEGEIRREPNLAWNGHPPARLGFAAVTFDYRGEEMICDDFQALTLRARPRDQRTYSVTLRGTAPLAPEVSYQGFVLAKPSATFLNMRCAFEDFVAVKGAHMLHSHRVLDVARFSAVSIAVADQRPGPFRFELEAIACTNAIDHSDHPIYNQRIFKGGSAAT